MSTFRDDHGVPHVRADSVTELAFEQGRVTARDRAWQLEIERRRGEGRTAELVGEGGLEWDVFARRALLADVARRAFAALDEETRSFVAAYVDGVNTAFADGVEAPELAAYDATPEPWEPWTPLAVFLAQHVLFGTFPSKLWRGRVREVLGDDAPFRIEGATGGSNCVLVGPGRTASGLPLVAGDPHRLFEAPNVYAQVRLACPEFDVLGFTFPGVPGVQHFAHTGEVAWGITNAMADYQDLYAERLERRGDEVWAVGPDGPEPVRRSLETVSVAGGEDVGVEVLVTDRGPVVLGGPGGEAWSLRTPAYVRGDLGLAALLPLLRARSVADVDAALEHWVEPVNDVLVADRAGRVLHRVAGLVPERPAALRRHAGRGEDGHQWTGWVRDLPRLEVGPDVVRATANARHCAAYARIGEDFAPPFRVDRIHELLDGRTGLTADRVAAVLADGRQNAGRVLLDVVADLPDLPDAAAALRDRLLAWDGTMAPDDPGAAAYASLRDRVVELVCAAPALAPLAEPNPYGDLWAPWFALPNRVAVCLHGILVSDSPFGLDVPALVTRALVDVAAAGAPPAWGERHVFHAVHAFESLGLEHAPTWPATPLPGDSDAVLAAGFLPGSTVCVRGPVARYAWDLAERDRSRWAVPLGASGVPDSPHHADQHAAWACGGTVPVVTDWDLLTEEKP